MPSHHPAIHLGRRSSWALALLLCALVAAVGAPPAEAAFATASFSYSPTVPRPNQDVFFSSNSEAAPGASITEANTVWDFENDGTPDTTGTAPAAHQFPAAGDYDVRLTVTDSDGNVASTVTTVRVQTPISPAFHYSPSPPLVGSTVTFTSDATGGDQPLTSSWDFGDGTPIVFGTPVTHRFATTGSHHVILTVSDGPQTKSVGKDILDNTPPTAAFTFFPAHPVEGQSIALISISSDAEDPLVRQEWDLDGDGSFGDQVGITATTTYSAGSHVVGLRVLDGRGASAVKYTTVVVAASIKAPKLLLPIPIVRMISQAFTSGTRVSLLTVKAPGGARIGIRCSGGHCPRTNVVHRVGTKTATVHFAMFQRFLRPGTTLAVSVTKKGTIGKYTRFRIRSGHRPQRIDACLKPGSSRPSACPS